MCSLSCIPCPYLRVVTQSLQLHVLPNCSSHNRCPLYAVHCPAYLLITQPVFSSCCPVPCPTAHHTTSIHSMLLTVLPNCSSHNRYLVYSVHFPAQFLSLHNRYPVNAAQCPAQLIITQPLSSLCFSCPVQLLFTKLLSSLSFSLSCPTANHNLLSCLCCSLSCPTAHHTTSNLYMLVTVLPTAHHTTTILSMLLTVLHNCSSHNRYFI